MIKQFLNIFCNINKQYQKVFFFADSIIWSENFMGNPNGVVETGTFKYTSILPYCRNVTNTEFLSRSVGPQSGRILIRNEDIDNFLEMKRFRVSF